MNFEKARFNMVEQQIRPWDVLDFDILDVLGEIPREDFVTEAQQPYAYSDKTLPLPNGGNMLEPKIVARMIQALKLAPLDKVLEVGTGSGYATALLGKMAAEVITVDIDAEQQARAKTVLDNLGYKNITYQVADGLAASATLDLQLAAQTRVVASAEKRRELSNLRYRAGQDSRLELLDAQPQVAGDEVAVRPGEIGAVGLARSLAGTDIDEEAVGTDREADARAVRLVGTVLLGGIGRGLSGTWHRLRRGRAGFRPYGPDHGLCRRGHFRRAFQPGGVRGPGRGRAHEGLRTAGLHHCPGFWRHCGGLDPVPDRHGQG